MANFRLAYTKDSAWAIAEKDVFSSELWDTGQCVIVLSLPPPQKVIKKHAKEQSYWEALEICFRATLPKIWGIGEVIII